MAYSIYCILIYTLLLCACFFAAILIASRVEWLLRQRERKAHREQAKQDMQNMNRLYNEIMLKQAVGGDFDNE